MADGTWESGARRMKGDRVASRRVPTLADKIEADAASRLALPEGSKPSQELPRYKAFLKVENHRLFMLHQGKAGGREVARARATVFDVLLRHILLAVAKSQEAAGIKVPKFALVALGGYGRGELNPLSDIDILFLHEGDYVSAGKAMPQLGALIDGLLYTLWDLGMKVGHSVRTLEDCARQANLDMQSKTSLIEARLVAGDAQLFERLQATIIAKCVLGFEDSYIAARVQDQATRRSKFGNTPFMQEPNIKNGCGGLRDYQNLLWMAFFKYRLRTLDQLEERELLTESEHKQLKAAYDFLMLVRNELHYTTKRPVDVLSKAVQPAVGGNLGYTERSPSKRVEEFMRDVYMHMRAIYIITRTLEERLALLPKVNQPKLAALRKIFQRRKNQPQVLDGFVIANGQISESTRSFKEQPRRLMRVFVYAQQRGLKLHPDLAQGIRNQLSLVNREFLEDAHIHQSFLELLNARGNVAWVLRSMHEVGLLGKFIPEFGRLTCLVQHEFYHQYTADEHTLVCIEKLDEVSAGKHPQYGHYTKLFQEIEKPYLLYLAVLLHDSGKGAPGDHSEVGARYALNVAARLGLDGSATHTLRLLIENHLTMVQISQRRDLEDPSVIRQFATTIQTRENLMMLTLHTFVDSMGTSSQLWNGFKDSLLWTLFSKTMQLFAGATDFTTAEHKELELLREEVNRMLPATFDPEEIQAHFSNLPARYFHIHNARQIASDITLAHRFMHLQLVEADMALVPVITWHNEQDRGYTSVHICTWDRAHLFVKIAGSLTAAGLNILSAQIFTRGDGIILDTFFVTDARGGVLAKKEEKEQFEKVLQESLTGAVDFPGLIKKARTGGRLYQSLEGEKIPTSIIVDNQTSESHTILDIETEDRVGLLYYISRTLSELNLDIALAKIQTEKGAAIDTFYVTTITKEKITDLDHLGYIEERLRDVLQALEG